MAAVQPGRIVWDAAADRFALACSCGSGLLELITSGGMLRHHCPDCGGTAPAGDWRPAAPREPTMLLDPDTVALWMADEVDQPDDTWATTSFGCGACQEGVIEARQHAGQIECRCSARGAMGTSGCWM